MNLYEFAIKLKYKGKLQMEANTLIPLSDVQKELGIGKTFLYQLLSQGKIAAVKLNRRTFVKKAELESFINDLKSYPVSGGCDE